MTGPIPPSPEALSQLFGKQLPLKVDQLLNFLGEIQEKGWDKDAPMLLRQHLQNITSMTKFLRIPSVEATILKLEEIMKPSLLNNSPPPTAEKIQTWQKYAKTLHEVISVNVVTAQESSWNENPLIRSTLILGLKDKQLADEISQQVKYFDYTCISYDSLEDVILATKENDPLIGAIILETEFCKAYDPQKLQNLIQKTSIIFISSHDDVITRLYAVKAGGVAFFVRPLEFTSLIEKLDQVVTPESESPPYRILIVEDSRTQANIINTQIQQASMITEVLMDPLKINDSLLEFQPDLILLDLYMPNCSGIELAKVIRQQDPFMSIPIVYLSVEEDVNKQLMAMKNGGGDFITKPTAPHHLIATIISRANRSRTLRAGMIQDSLTGLLNHTRILEQLDLEIARAKRNNTPLSLAMLDIDNFKTVNDSHGHPVGDRVIKGLARLLRQRLRKMDNIGRYGGEEYAIIFPQSEGASVYKKLDEIRRGFANLLHRSCDPSIEFSATFSMGLAQLSKTNDSVDKLVQAADKALYAAKERGRNCIVFNQES